MHLKNYSNFQFLFRLGENGVPVNLEKDEDADYKAKFDLNKFNLIASDKIALNRSLPDFRLDG